MIICEATKIVIRRPTISPKQLTILRRWCITTDATWNWPELLPTNHGGSNVVLNVRWEFKISSHVFNKMLTR